MTLPKSKQALINAAAAGGTLPLIAAGCTAKYPPGERVVWVEAVSRQGTHRVAFRPSVPQP